MSTTQEQIALWGGTVYAALTGVSLVSVAATRALTRSGRPVPAWLAAIARWSGVLAADIHKMAGGDS